MPTLTVPIEMQVFFEAGLNGLPISSSTPCHRIASTSQALQTLLYNPINYIPATSLTFSDEANMAPILRMRRSIRQRESAAQWSKQSLTRHIPATWQKPSAGPILSRGLSNPNVLCYQNSVFQALLHTPKFVNWLELDHQYCEIADCTVCILRDFCVRYWDRPSKRLRLAEDVARLRRRMRRMKSFTIHNWEWSRQQDADEFCGLLLDAISEQDPLLELMTRSLFYFETITTLTCPNCKGVTPNLCFDRVLRAPCEGHSTLEGSLFNGLFRRDMTQERRCDACKVTANMPETLRMRTGPEVLTVQFQRWNHRGEKNTSYVAFTQDLDLTNHTEHKSRLKYRLLSVVLHKGSMNHGHYKAVVKCPGGTWEEVEDDRVTRVTKARLKVELNPAGAWTPYLLFYGRVDEVSCAETNLRAISHSPDLCM